MNRLYPSKNSGRYYILTKLRLANQYLIEKHLKEKQLKCLVDFGCGNSPYKPLFKNVVEKYYGADIHTNCKADLIINEKGQIPIEDESVDVILSTQVIEHVENVSLYLREAYRILKPDGYFILSTHGYWMYHPDPNDYWRWTKKGLEITIKNHNFIILEILGIMGLAATGLQLFQDSIVPKLKPKLKKLFIYFICFIQKKFDNGSFFHNDASVYVVISKK